MAQAGAGRDRALQGVITPQNTCLWCDVDLAPKTSPRYRKKFCTPQHKALWHARERAAAVRREVIAEVRAEVRDLLDRLERG